MLTHHLTIRIGHMLIAVLWSITGHGQNTSQDTETRIERTRNYITANWDGTVMHASEAPGNAIPLPFPYNVPTVQGETAFRAMFYWDTYFTNLGLLRDGRIQQARNNVDNILFLVDQYGKMPNGSTRAFLNRSQPPYLSMMVAEVFGSTKDTAWLKKAVGTLEREYRFWMTERLAPNGLNRYGSSATDDQKRGMAKLWASRSASAGLLNGMGDQALVHMGGHVVAEAESGWDFNPRFDNRCEDFNPIDLNSNLYRYERNFAAFYRILKDETAAAQWDRAAETRSALMNRYCLDPESGLFTDFDYENNRLSEVISAAQFSVLYAGVANERQAEALVRSLGLLETAFGIKTCADGPRDFTYQWDSPNGWPPLHYLAVKGLADYGYVEHAQRIGRKYINLVADNFARTGYLWEKYNVKEGSVNTVNEYEMPKFLGWTAGVFIALLDLVEGVPDHYAAYRESWLGKARANMPRLVTTKKYPLCLVEIAKNDAAFQGYVATPVSSINRLYVQPFPKKGSLTLDFGEHLTGRFHFSLRALNRVADAPVKLKFTFGEVPSEMTTPFDPYPGSLARGWLQDEDVTVMTMSDTVRIERRMSFRYVKVEVVGAPNYEFAFTSAYCLATTSASNTPEPLAVETDAHAAALDSIGLITLRECMQTVFEDGPKRDRRLWTGDLYLQSLANNYSFQQHDLTRRCLYLLAGLSARNGYLYPTVFEQPFPHAQSGRFLLEYTLLYNATLNAYLDATGDEETARDLWPVAERQVDIVRELVKPDGLVDYQKANKDWWVFFDWKPGLHKEAALQGFFVFALRETYDLARKIGKEEELRDVPALIDKMTDAAMTAMYDPERHLFVGIEDRQVAYASQIWMVLGGVVSGETAKQVLLALEKTHGAVKPNSPYLYHYYIQALINAGLPDQARDQMMAYWGGMLRKGADTFWEVFNEDDELLSPYGFYPMNSYCHAWSCTPVYFIRKYPDIFSP